MEKNPETRSSEIAKAMIEEIQTALDARGQNTDAETLNDIMSIVGC